MERELLGVFHHLLYLYNETGLKPLSYNNTMETLLLASIFKSLSGRENLLIIAANSQPDSVEAYL